MKLKLLLIACLSITCIARGQRKTEYPYIYHNDYMSNFVSYDWQLDNQYKINQKTQKEKVSKALVKAFTVTTKEKKKEYISLQMTYDQKGNCLSAFFNKKNGKTCRQFHFTYSPTNKILSKTMSNAAGEELKKVAYEYSIDRRTRGLTFYRRGKEIRKNKDVYDSVSNTYTQEYYRKGKLKKKIVSLSDSVGVRESYFYKNGSPAYKYKWVYTYYDNKSKRSSMIYKADGKVKYTWNYDCRPDGEMQTKHKDTTMVCERKEYDSDSSCTYTYRKFDDNGKPQKVVYKISKDKKRMLMYATYKENDIPVNFWKYNKITGETEQQIIYGKKGKEQFRTDYLFDSNNNNIETDSYRKGKQVGKTLLEYNSPGLVRTETYYEKGKLKSTSKYDYTYYQ